MLRSLLSGQGLLTVLIHAIVLFTALPIHEFSHGYIANKLGDDTAYYAGRLTLNPFAHFDLWGSLCLLLCGFGWAKPVPVNPVKFRKTSMKTGMALTALAGPVSNLILAFLAYTLMKLSVFVLPRFIPNTETVSILVRVFATMSSVNLSLCVFNLIPIPPLDGSRIAYAILPDRIYWGMMKYEQYIRIGLFVLIFIGVFDTPIYVIKTVFFKLFDVLTLFIDKLF